MRVIPHLTLVSKTERPKTDRVLGCFPLIVLGITLWALLLAGAVHLYAILQ